MDTLFRNLRTSFCMTCKNRLHHVQETLPITLSNILFEDEVVLLDFDSEDGLSEWVKDLFQEEISGGQLRLVQLQEKSPWHPTRAKNIAHRSATRGIVCNLDADNWVLPGFSQWLRDTFTQGVPMITHMSSQSLGGGFGRIALSFQDFVNLGGYDERIKSWGWDDDDLLARAKAAGYTSVVTPDQYIAFLKHRDDMRVFSAGTNNRTESLALNREFTKSSLASGQWKVNQGSDWGSGQLVIHPGGVSRGKAG